MYKQDFHKRQMPNCFLADFLSAGLHRDAQYVYQPCGGVHIG